MFKRRPIRALKTGVILVWFGAFIGCCQTSTTVRTEYRDTTVAVPGWITQDGYFIYDENDVKVYEGVLKNWEDYAVVTDTLGVDTVYAYRITYRDAKPVEPCTLRIPVSMVSTVTKTTELSFSDVAGYIGIGLLLGVLFIKILLGVRDSKKPVS